MSSTSIISFSNNAHGQVVVELNNAWISAPLLWNYLSKKYLNKDSIPYDKEGLNTFWSLWKGSRLEDWEAAALVSTYDNCVVKKEDFNKLIGYYNKLDKVLNRENHFRSIIKELEKIKDEDIIGVGFIWTSVAGDIWNFPKNEDCKIANISLLTEDEDFFFLFDDDYLKNRNIKINEK